VQAATLVLLQNGRTIALALFGADGAEEIGR
jgi:hypothetical protein